VLEHGGKLRNGGVCGCVGTWLPLLEVQPFGELVEFIKNPPLVYDGMLSFSGDLYNGNKAVVLVL
jgi:hypothetical protein